MRGTRRALLATGIIATLFGVVTLIAAPALLVRSGLPLSLRERLAIARASLWARAAGFRLRRDIAYRGDVPEVFLDLLVPAQPRDPPPVVLYFHGGGWVEGSRGLASLAAVDWARRGFAVANVGYRLADAAPAPAAVEDARCAAAWVARNADRFGIDAGRIVATGVSAGAHLALMTGLPARDAGFDACGPVPPLTAVVNWYGPTDLAGLDSSGARELVTRWLGPNAADGRLARRVSPITWVRPDAPLVLTVHGALDDLIPVGQARRLHAALDSAGARHRLRVLPDGGHGFTKERTRALLDTLAREALAPATAEPGAH